MKINKKLEELNDDDIIDVTTSKSGDNLRIGATSFELADNALIIRKNGNGYKEKTLIDLDNIIYTKVRKNANSILLILSIFFLVLGGGATYPLYLYISNFAFIALGVGVLVFAILISIYLSKRNIRITIYLKKGEKIQRTGKDMRLFEKANKFFDNLFYIKHH